MKPGLGDDEDHPVCSFSVRKYVIYYRPTADGIMVARALHRAREHGPLLEP